MRRLVDQMLDLSRVQQGLGLGLVLKPADVSAIVTDVANETRSAYPGAELEVDAHKLHTVLERSVRHHFAELAEVRPTFAHRRSGSC